MFQKKLNFTCLNVPLNHPHHYQLQNYTNSTSDTMHKFLVIDILIFKFLFYECTYNFAQMNFRKLANCPYNQIRYGLLKLIIGWSVEGKNRVRERPRLAQECIKRILKEHDVIRIYYTEKTSERQKRIE